jgi:hypothetical protein
MQIFDPKDQNFCNLQLPRGSWCLPAVQSAEKLDLEFDFGWRRFTAAISDLFSVLALAAEGDSGVHEESFSKLR